MTLCPRFEITGRYRNPDSLHRFQPELRSERSGQESYRRVMDMDEGLSGNFGTDPILLKAAKSFVLVPLAEIPNHLPQTARSHPTKHDRATGPEQSGEILGECSEVLDTVQCSEI
jgi:hypothetical protein